MDPPPDGPGCISSEGTEVPVGRTGQWHADELVGDGPEYTVRGGTVRDCGPLGTASEHRRCVCVSGDAGGDDDPLAQMCGAAPSPTAAATLPALTETDRAMCALRALAPEIQDASLICSGEGSHGVAESFVLHALIARYLSRSGRLDTVAIETPASYAEQMNPYVVDGDRAVFDAVWAATPPSKRDPAFGALFHALREENARRAPGEPPITVTGFDVELPLDTGLTMIVDYVNAVGGDGASWRRRFQTNDRTAMLAAVRELRAWFDRERAQHIARVGADRYEAMNHFLVSCEAGTQFGVAIQQGSDFTSGYLEGNGRFREPAIVRNLLRLANRPGTRTLAIAHNGHCGRGSVAGNDGNGNDVYSAGTTVGSMLGTRYATILQLYGGGQERWPTDEIGPWEASAGTLEGALAARYPEALVFTREWSEWSALAQLPRGESASRYLGIEDITQSEAFIYLPTVRAIQLD